MPTRESELSLPVSVTFPKSRKEGLVSRLLSLVCSVRLGVVLLVLLGLACLTGMLIMQQNVDGFERYFAQLTPAQRFIYGNLGFFDIYHAWYFNALLAALSTNIILASIDRFPKTWRIARRRKLTVPMHWLRDQKGSMSLAITGEKEEIVAKAREQLRQAGFRNIAVGEKNGRSFVFGESGVWNRFGAYAVHIGLLTIFAGGFMTSQFGHTGNMPLSPGQTSNQISEIAFELDQMRQIDKVIPFEIYCTDIQQKLIRKDGPINAGNTIDWLTSIRIKDETGSHDAVVQMNRPFDYRGYRFFQASFVPVGRARTITVKLTDGNGRTQLLNLKRDGTATLANGTKIEFVNFRGNFNVGQENPNEDTSMYPNPGAVLQVTTEKGDSKTAYAFPEGVGNIPVATNVVAGFTFQLADFEKVPDQHVLSVQRDPGSNVVYIGFALLFLALAAVFFFSHKRIWTAIETDTGDGYTLTVGGDTNRNQTAFDEKANRFFKGLKKSLSTDRPVPNSIVQ